jgi:hypothetical protein
VASTAPHGGLAVSLHRVPIGWRTAKAFCIMWHRHHAPPRGGKFWVGAADAKGVLRAVAIGGRPVAREFDNGQTIEVTRVASDGSRNACSMLYAACRDAAWALGYTRVITYTQEGESGASLKAAGYRIIAERPARPGWDTPSRPREPKGTEEIPRTLWEAA